MSSPSSVGIDMHSSYGRGPKRSSARGSTGAGGRRRRRRSRSAATPTATPVAATPIMAPMRPAPRAIRRSATGVHPRHPYRAHPGHDLVVDGADRVGPVVGGRLAALARAEEDRDVTGGHRVVAAVDHDLVHAHPTGDGTPLAGNPYRAGVGAVAGYPVAVPEGDDRERGLPRGRVRVPVRDPL